jgi:hypothetical protein
MRAIGPRVLAVLLVALAAVGGGVLLLRDDGPEPLRPGDPDSGRDPLAFREADSERLEARAAQGLAHVLYAKSPGGAVASAERTARWRPQIEAITAASGGVVDADTLEAIVLLESAGRPDARASEDLSGAVGLTQILAETGQNLLGMKIDVEASRTLTRRIARGGPRRAARERERRRIDERFDPAKALAASVRYLKFARGELGDRLDLAVAGYHMGVGNLQTALRLYDEGDDVPYVRLYFDTTPEHKTKAFDFLRSLGDDSSTYLWRVYAARDIMRRWRAGADGLREHAALHTAKNSAEEVLHPEGSTTVYEDPDAVRAAQASGELIALDPERMTRNGLTIDRRMGELARRVDESARLYRALRPEALELLEYIGVGVRELSGVEAPLVVTSTVRDREYQRLLVRRNREATRAYSLHTTGFSFDISRDYASRRQAQAFQYLLDRLTALNLIAWVREPGAIHVTVSGDAARLLHLAG